MTTMFLEVPAPSTVGGRVYRPAHREPDVIITLGGVRLTVEQTGTAVWRGEPSVPLHLVVEILADWWHRDTDASSLLSEAVEHPAYVQIKGLGRAIVPFILEDLEQRGGHWFNALRHIVGADAPTEPRGGGVAAVKQAWLDWGRAQNMI